MRRPGSALLATAILTSALGACGGTPTARIAGQPATSSAARPPAMTPATAAARTRAAGRRRTHKSRHRRSRMASLEATARAAYRVETRGRKLREELARIAHDPALLGALGRGDRAGAQAAAEAELSRPGNHIDHVTRIGVVRGSRVLVNATVNADGVFVVAPAKRRALHWHGRTVGTLVVSIQDLTGYVKLVHDLTGADAVVRGSSGRERSSLPAASGVALPKSGQVTIAGRSYSVRSFAATGWGKEAVGREPLTVWILG